MPSHGQYLILLSLCLLITLPLEFIGARVYRRPARLMIALLPVVLIFSVWDIVGIARGHWTYNPRYLSGVQIVAGMPLEELAFFVVVPLCGLLTYGAVGRMLVLRRRKQTRPAIRPAEGQRDA